MIRELVIDGETSKKGSVQPVVTTDKLRPCSDPEHVLMPPYADVYPLLTGVVNFKGMVHMEESDEDHDGEQFGLTQRDMWVVLRGTILCRLFPKPLKVTHWATQKTQSHLLITFKDSGVLPEETPMMRTLLRTAVLASVSTS